MSELRVYVRDLNRELSFITHYGTGCRLVSAIDENTNNFDSLLEKAYEFDRGIYDEMSMDSEENYRREFEFFRKHKLDYTRLKPYPNKERFDAGVIEIHFPSRTIISDQSGDYICHRGVRETWGYTGPYLDFGRFKKFSIPEYWTIIDRYFFGKPVKIEGDIDRELEKKLWERVEWYKKMGYEVDILE